MKRRPDWQAFDEAFIRLGFFCGTLTQFFDCALRFRTASEGLAGAIADCLFIQFRQ